VSDSGLFSSDYSSQPRHDLHFSASFDELTNEISSWRSGGTRLMQSTVPGSCVVLGYFIARCGGGMSGPPACSELRIFLHQVSNLFNHRRVDLKQLSLLKGGRAKLTRRSSGLRTHGAPRLPDIPLWHIDRPSTTLPLMAGLFLYLSRRS
jgi:hypothetical protein